MNEIEVYKKLEDICDNAYKHYRYIEEIKKKFTENMSFESICKIIAENWHNFDNNSNLSFYLFESYYVKEIINDSNSDILAIEKYIKENNL